MVNYNVKFSSLLPNLYIYTTVKLGDKELFDKEQIGVKEPFLVTNCKFVPYQTVPYHQV